MDAIYYRSPKKNLGKKIFLSFLIIVFLAAIGYGGFFTWKIYAVGKKINIENEKPPSFFQTARSLTSATSIDLKGYESGRINILLLGIGGKGHPGQNLTDTIMLASLNTKTNQVALYSIPRDMYVEVADESYSVKINTVYQLGLASAKNNTASGADLIVKTIEKLTAQKINYYAILNFGGFEKIIDTIGGINIMSERDIYDPTYPGPNYSYAPFKLEKGFHHLDGATALKYARERHNDPEGDFGRAKRQQQVLQSAKNKIFSAGTFLNPVAINSLLDALGENIITNVTPAEIISFLELAQKMDTQNINNVVLDAWNKDSLLKIVHINNFSALVPRVGNLSEIQELAQNVFDLDKMKRTREEIAAENTRVAIVNQSEDAKLSEKIRKLLNVNLDYKNVVVLNNLNQSSIDISTVYDSTNGAKPFTANELVTKLPAQISYSAYPLPAYSGSKFDVVVVLGKDLAAKYNMEEGTLEELNQSRDEQESADFNNK